MNRLGPCPKAGGEEVHGNRGGQNSRKKERSKERKIHYSNNKIQGTFIVLFCIQYSVYSLSNSCPNQQLQLCSYQQRFGHMGFSGQNPVPSSTCSMKAAKGNFI